MVHKTLSILILLGILNAPLFSCDYCLLTQGISPLETAHGLGLRLDERYTRLSNLFDHGEKTAAGSALETHWTTQVTAFYSITPRLTISAVIPFARRFEQEGDSHHEARIPISPQWKGVYKTTHQTDLLHSDEDNGGKSFGLSDISLIARYQLYQKHSLSSTFLIAMQAGVRLPTGKTNATNDSGEILNAHIQPGTGAFTYILGVSLSYALQRITLIANGLVGLPGKGEVGEDSYQYGNSVTYDTALRYRLTSSLQAPIKVFLTAGIAGEYRKQEKQNELLVSGTGGHTVYATPGIQLFFHPFIVELSFWQPVYQNLNGLQLGETFKTYGGLTFLLR